MVPDDIFRDSSDDGNEKIGTFLAIDSGQDVPRPL
jgi:hypothetical protein